jgi:hypothetical protein
MENEETFVKWMIMNGTFVLILRKWQENDQVKEGKMHIHIVHQENLHQRAHQLEG